MRVFGLFVWRRFQAAAFQRSALQEPPAARDRREAIGAEFYKKVYAELNYSQSDEIAGRTSMPVFAAVLLDHIMKTNMLEFFRSRLHVQRKAEDNEPEFSRAERVPFMINAVKRMHDEAARRGSDFVFILMPYDKTLDEASAVAATASRSSTTAPADRPNGSISSRFPRAQFALARGNRAHDRG